MYWVGGLGGISSFKTMRLNVALCLGFLLLIIYDNNNDVFLLLCLLNIPGLWKINKESLQKRMFQVYLRIHFTLLLSHSESVYVCSGCLILL